MEFKEETRSEDLVPYISIDGELPTRPSVQTNTQLAHGSHDSTGERNGLHDLVSAQVNEDHDDQGADDELGEEVDASALSEAKKKNKRSGKSKSKGKRGLVCRQTDDMESPAPC